MECPLTARELEGRMSLERASEECLFAEEFSRSTIVGPPVKLATWWSLLEHDSDERGGKLTCSESRHANTRNNKLLPTPLAPRMKRTSPGACTEKLRLVMITRPSSTTLFKLRTSSTELDMKPLSCYQVLIYSQIYRHVGQLVSFAENVPSRFSSW